ncbi:hypothetical protein ACIRBY_22945 [Streptomyces sp. NPDC096136]|uniref:hypothetical protein n=1 Tax=Streptomyces sp. NPDC096136 TaxID=3366076 RepID=UPI0037F1F3AF
MRWPWSARKRREPRTGEPRPQEAAAAAEAGDWRDWLARSPAGAELVGWWHGERELTARFGADHYRARLAALLSRAAPRDVAAMGLGCSRRVDRPCRTPGVCGRDPEPAGGLRLRSGPVPGACSRFIDCWTPHEVRVHFTSDDRHRAVLLLRGGPDAARLWVDGAPVGEGERLDNGGHWEDDRFYVIRIGGPADHPAQGLGDFGDWLYRIVSLLVYDADRALAHVLVPRPGEHWTDPVVRIRDGTARVYATGDAEASGTVDRSFPVDGPAGSHRG